MLPQALPALLMLQAQPTFYAAWEDARDAERRNQFASALAAYERAAELRPQSAAQVIIYGNNLLQGYYPYTRIARCALELARWDDAERALAKADQAGEPLTARQALRARLREARPAPPPNPPPAPGPQQAAPQHPAASPHPVGPATVPAPEPPPAQASAPPPPAPAPTAALPPERRPALRETPVAPAPTALPLPPPPAPAKAAPLPLPWLLSALGLVTVAAFFLGRRKRPVQTPERVGPYHLERLLGRGGFASTYLARRDGQRDPVALKLLHPFRQDDPEFLARFRQEARLGALLDHPHIVRLLDQGPEDDTPWLAMEFVEGSRLDALLKARGTLPLPMAVEFARQVASAMAYAHGKGVVHRDLKPSNVMIVGSRAKVMDFGIARIMDVETLTTTYAFLGTPLYAAPELQLKTQVGPAADRYSFGIMLFELLAGHPPFRGETPFEIMDQHRSADLPELRALRPDAPAELVDLVNRLTRKDPATRPEDDEILAVLGALA